MITEDYVSFETAKLLKEKRFDCPCHATYDTAVTGGKPKFSEYEVLSYFPYGMKNTDDKYGMVISAPTLQMAMKWLRKIHNIHIAIVPYEVGPGVMDYTYILYKVDTENFYFTDLGIQGRADTDKMSASKTCEAAIKYCLENVI
jgi:hypothetical protein